MFFIDTYLELKDSLIKDISKQLLDTAKNKQLYISDFKTQILLDKFYYLDQVLLLKFCIHNFDVLKKESKTSEEDALEPFPFLKYISENYSSDTYIEYLLGDSRFRSCLADSVKDKRNTYILSEVILRIINSRSTRNNYFIHLKNVQSRLKHRLVLIKNNNNECLLENALKLENWLESFYESHKD